MTAEANVSDDNLASAVKAMEELVDEAVQVYELEKEKSNVTDDLYNSLKIITSYLGFSIDLDPHILNLPENSRATLTPVLDIIIIKPDYKSEQKRFDQLTLDEASGVLQYAIPRVISLARSDRITKNKKLSFLRESTKALKRLPGTNAEEMIVGNESLHLERAGS
ncbi:MAG: hypothetical protein KGI25_03160 [Thaumarchaeota archaeon]|nr:hypothetical protein [Nitrososphaerota archaeon]